jgi:hypothetical protein
MALTAYDDTAAFGAFVPHDGSKENSRIIGAFLIKRGFDITDLTSDPATWAAGITAKDIIVINPVTGSFPEGTENTIPGIGRIQTEFSNIAYDVTFRHKGADANLAFYNKLLKSKEYGVGFVFHDNKAYVPLDGTVGDPDATPTPIPDSFRPIMVDFFPRVMTDGENLEGDRFIMVNCRWTSASLPYAMEVPQSLFPA